ncbi:sigma-54 dependent transcriptional regulator [bacterium]|nr:sigma-54 dependent transcriptional regulator [bacterium]
MEKILIIDDEENIRQMLHVLLSSEGYETRMAEDGEQGLSLMNSFQPRIIILDLKMPKMGGIDFLKQLQSTDDMRYLIIVLTGYGTDKEVQICYQLGVHSFMRKPVNIHEILGLVKSNLALIQFSEKLKQEKKEKEKTNLLLKKTYDSMSEGVITLDSNLRIEMLSNKACRILDVTEDKALRKPAVSILGKLVAGPSGILMHLPEHSKEISEIQTLFHLSTGATIPVYLTIKPLNGKESKEGWLLLFRDKREEERVISEQTGAMRFGRMVSNDSRMIEIFQFIDTIANSNTTVLIEGETGTGKELVAREIHDRSRRSQNLFHVINCATIPVNLLESELFGHERGAFTGAVKGKVGRFELADKGTLLLDEIGEISLEMQVKLLRVLQEQKFERVGGTKSIQVDVRVIAATNQNLKELLHQKRFREDLFYRLDVISVNLPPLRDRLMDIPALVSYFLKELNHSENREVRDVSSEVILRLLSYSWPGNIRELFHVIEYAFAVSKGHILTHEHLPKKLKPESTSPKVNDSLIKNEKNTILNALKQASYDKKKVSGLLGISLTTLYRKLKKYRI